MATIQFHHVCKSFAAGTAAVRDFNLEIADGEFVVLVGPSGCGKSTLLRMLAGLEEVTSGEIRIGDRIVNGLPPQERDVAMVFQNYALYPHKTVRQNLEFPLRMAGWPRARINSRVAEVAHLLELESLLERKPAQLSGGQRQRVAMGRALVREPAVFLMDEPLSNLDAQLRVQMRREITALQKRLGTTTIYVTHDQVEAMTMGDRLAVLNHGELLQAGSPKELYAHPADIFVATFLGSPKMNLFDCVTTPTADGRPGFRLGNLLLPLPAPIANRLASAADAVTKRIFAGFRPEGFQLTAPGSHPHSIPVHILAVESLGHEQLVYLEAEFPAAMVEDQPDTHLKGPKFESEGFTARLSARVQVRPGESMELPIDPTQAHFFDSRGRALGGLVD